MAVLKKLSYSVIANLISLLVSVIMVMFVPKFLSLEDYGTWQLFLFYFSYLGFFHFGWEDGIYLRYAGKSFDELDQKTFAGQFYGIIALQILVALCIIGVGAFLVTDPVKSRVLYCVSALVLFVNFNNECNQIMQFTNRIKDYAKLLLTERLLLLVSVLILLTTGFRSFPAMYTAKVVSVTSTFLLSAYLCRRFLRPTFYPAKTILSETAANISVGIKLMFANIASMLIIGAVRYGISIGWDVSTFGKVSLTLGISNFLMVFINAVSIVLFPMLKHVEQDKLAPLYIRIHSGLSYALLAMLITYFPLKSILSWWLPKYAPSLVYMAVLFPVCMYESKVALLVNTYLKSMRQEFLMLKINVVSVVVSVVCDYIDYRQGAA